MMGQTQTAESYSLCFRHVFDCALHAGRTRYMIHMRMAGLQ